MGGIVKLIKSFHGTRDAPMIWANHLAETLTKLGLVRTKLNPASSRCTIGRQPDKRTAASREGSDSTVVSDFIRSKMLSSAKGVAVWHVPRADHKGEQVGHRMDGQCTSGRKCLVTTHAVSGKRRRLSITWHRTVPTLWWHPAFCARSVGNPRIGDEVWIKRCILYLKCKPYLSIYQDGQDQDWIHVFTRRAKFHAAECGRGQGC